jgi:hypothetical protein
MASRYPDPVRNNLGAGVEDRTMSDLYADPPDVGLDANEADALEQSQEVPTGDEEDRDR